MFIRLNGILSKETGKSLSVKLKELIYKYGFKYFVLNLQELSFIDEDGISILKNRYKDMLTNNGKLIICNNDNDLYKEEINTSFINCTRINNELDAFKIIEI